MRTNDVAVADGRAQTADKPRGLTRRSFFGAGAAAALGGAALAAQDGCPICSIAGSPLQALAAEERKATLTKFVDGEVPDLISSADEVWAMSETHELTEHTRAAWNLHRSVIEATMAGGWENKKHAWHPDRQAFYRYPLAFGAYGIPSLVMIDNDEYENAVVCLRKSILLMKENAAWSDWTRNEYGTDAVYRYNIMYKGHLNLMYGLYQMMTGDDLFESEYQAITRNIVEEYRENIAERGFIGIECEPDQYFYPCNSVGMMSLLFYDKNYGTDYAHEFVEPQLGFLKRTMTDPELHIPYFRWHPTHGNAENMTFGDWWTLAMIHVFDPEFYDLAWENSKRLFTVDILDGRACFTRAALTAEGISTDMEQRTWIFYLPFCSKEYDDKETWTKIHTFFRMQYETDIEEDGLLRFHDHVDDETMMEAYWFLGDVHQGWRAVLDYDWSELKKRFA